jgi:lipoprotein-releasing system permease protein
LDINGIIIVVLMILVATMNMVTALLILILERTNMVGLVKALGMPNVSVRKIFLFVSYRLIGRGMLWGNLFGIGLCLLQSQFKIAKLDSETYYVDFVAIDINWLYFILLNIGTFVVCGLMLLLPTLIITKLTPIKTLKFD